MYKLSYYTTQIFEAIFIELFENLLISLNFNHVLAYKDQCIITFFFFSF